MINFTRASTATYIDTGGVLRVAAINEPRFEKDGILIEGTGTNLMVNSTNEGSWNGYGENRDFTELGDGYTLLTSQQGVNRFRASRPTYIENTNTYTYSAFINTRESSSMDFTFGDLVRSSKVILTTSPNNLKVKTLGALVDSCMLEELIDGVFRIKLTVTDTDTNRLKYVGVEVSNISTTTKIAIGNAQIEGLPFATSYIPTEGAAVTRAADNLSLSKGTLEMDTSDISIFGDAVSYTKGGSSYAHWLYASSSTPVEFGYKNKILYAKYGVDPDLVVKEAVNESKMGLTYDRDSKVLKAYSGSNVGSHEYNSLPNDIGNVLIGGSAHKWFGHIKNFRVWNKVLTPNQISLL